MFVVSSGHETKMEGQSFTHIIRARHYVVSESSPRILEPFFGQCPSLVFHVEIRVSSTFFGQEM